MTIIDDSGLTLSTARERLANLKIALQAIVPPTSTWLTRAEDSSWLLFASGFSTSIGSSSVYNGRSPRSARGAGLARLACLSASCGRTPVSRSRSRSRPAGRWCWPFPDRERRGRVDGDFQGNHGRHSQRGTAARRRARGRGA